MTGHLLARCVVAGALVGWAVTPASAQASKPAEGIPAQGILKPTGPPTHPTRVDAGGSCIVDLAQDYALSGTLAGTATIDYRILVHGPCGSPPGTFAEQWIAFGEFHGEIGGAEGATHLTDVATVAAGGEVTGTIALGPERSGELRVSGRFSDGHLSYSGSVR